MQEVAIIDGQKVLATRICCSALRGLRCSIHKNKPNLCKQFPVAPDHKWYEIALQNGCTFRFKKIKIKHKQKYKATFKLKENE